MAAWLNSMYFLFEELVFSSYAEGLSSNIYLSSDLFPVVILCPFWNAVICIKTRESLVPLLVLKQQEIQLMGISAAE